MKVESKLQEKIPKKKVSLEIYYQRLGHKSTSSLLSGDTPNFWQDIEIRVDPNPFCTSYSISTINKKYISKTHLNPKTPFKWVFMDTTPATSSKTVTKDTTFSN